VVSAALWAVQIATYFQHFLLRGKVLCVETLRCEGLNLKIAGDPLDVVADATGMDQFGHQCFIGFRSGL